MDDLFQRIRRLCFEKGTSIRKLCEETGISRNTLYSLKNKGRAIGMRIDTLQKIADNLGVTISELTGETTSYAPANKDTERGAEEHAADEMISILQGLKDRPELKMLFKSAQKATPAQIETISQLLDSMSGKETDND